MPTVTFSKVVKEPIEHAFNLVGDFSSYPALAPKTVRDIKIISDDRKGTTTSHWCVNFRNGVLEWVETDLLDKSSYTITFRQDNGDFELMEGYWKFEEQELGTQLNFKCEFDFGVPSLESIINPVAAKLLQETMEQIIEELFKNDKQL